MAIRYVGHILWRDRNADFQPEKPIIDDRDLGPGTRFTFIDIIPGILKPKQGTYLGRRDSATYNPFSALVEKGNEWLAKNSDWEVVNCETVLFFFKPNEAGQWHLVPDLTCFPLDGEAHSSLMALRLWIRRHDHANLMDEHPHSIQYRDFVPAFKQDNSLERLEDLVHRVNIWCRGGYPNASQIVTIETLFVPTLSPTAEWQIDPELTLHSFPSRYLAILRIFYSPSRSLQSLNKALNTCAMHFEIGVQDFLPTHVSGGGFFRKPQFDPVSTCISRAGDWIQKESVNTEKLFANRLQGEDAQLILKQRCFEFKNAQCLEVRMRGIHKVDSGVMRCASDRGDYLRMFRVAYVRLVDDKSKSTKEKSAKKKKAIQKLKKNEITNELEDTPGLYTIHLSSIIFTPADRDATVAEIKRKMHLWVEKCCKEFMGDENDEIMMHSRKPRVLSAETVEIFTKGFSEEEIQSETENTFQFNRIGTMNAFLFMAFRIYVDVGMHGAKRHRSHSVASIHRRNQKSCLIT